MDDKSDAMHMSLSKLWEIMKDRKPWHATVYGSIVVVVQSLSLV